MKKMLAAFLVVLGMLAGGLVGSGAAQAAPPPCVSGTFCLFNNGSDPWEHVSSWSGGVTRNACLGFTSVGDVSYVVNKTSTRWFIFRDSNCAGAHIEIPPIDQGQIQVYGSGWDNDPVAVMRTSYTY